MDATHLHLLFNHAAIFGIIFSWCILVAGMLLKSGILQRTAMVGFVIAAVAAAITMNSGEGAEERLEQLPGFVESTVEAHEESAEWSIWLIGCVGFLGMVGLGLWVKGRALPRLLQMALLIFGLAATVAIMNTGLLGGKIRHTELSGEVRGIAVPGGEEDED